MQKQNNSDFGKYDFVGKVWLFGGLSALFVVVSIIYLAIHGISYGIDFKGGTEMQVKFAQPVTIDQMRATTDKLGLPGLALTAFNGASEYVVRFQTHKGKDDKETNDLQNRGVESLRHGLETDLGASKPEILRVDSVGPQVGNELKRNGLLAVFYCLLVILIYVSLRFDYKYAPGAVVCLAHDAIITLAIFVAVGKEVNIPILAAILTLIGFSLNDTIVVFDRIREGEGHSHGEGTRTIINRAINEMMGRTIITSGTTFVSALFLYIFAEGTVSDIAFAMCIGIFFGTYSSIYVAAPFALLMEKFKAPRVAARTVRA